MVVIVWDETIEDKLRKEYDIPCSVSTEDIYTFVGKRMAERTLDKVRLSLDMN